MDDLGLMEALVAGREDPVTLAEQVGMSVMELGEWIARPGHRETLAGLCLLADLQTQVQLARYRMLAANRLIRLATGEDETASADVARKACVDLLKLNMQQVKTSDVGPPEVGSPEEEAAGEGEGVLDVEGLRGVLYGEGDL